MPGSVASGTLCICWGFLLNKQKYTVFGNMDMLKVNTDRNIATQDRHAIQLNKYFKENKYQSQMQNVLQ